MTLWKNLRHRLRMLVRPRRGWWVYVRRDIRRLARIHAEPHAIALGFAYGAFVSFTPFVGFHFLMAGALSLLTRANLLASFVGTIVGNPLTFPFIWVASYALGTFILGLGQEDFDATKMLDPFAEGLVSFDWELLRTVGLPILVGGLPLGLLVGVACYFPVRAGVIAYRRRRAERRRGGKR